MSKQSSQLLNASGSIKPKVAGNSVTKSNPTGTIPTKVGASAHQSTDDEQEYRRLDDALGEIEHNLLRPHNNLGDVVPETKTQWIYNLATQTMEKATFVLSVGLEQSFRECITNSADALEKGSALGLYLGQLEVWLNPTTVAIKNYGKRIKVIQDPTDGLWWPELLFSHMRTSSNLDDTKEDKVAGQNGIGIKIVVIFSKRFYVRIVDAVAGLVFEQTYTNNMRVRSAPIITPLTTPEPSSTQIVYDLDMERFGLTEYSPEVLGLFARYTLEVAMDNMVPLVLNGQTMPTLNIESYARTFYPTNQLYTYIEPESRLQICYVDAPNSAMTMGWVNGIYTPRDGVHVKAAYDQAFGAITGNMSGDSRRARLKASSSARKSARPGTAAGTDVSLPAKSSAADKISLEDLMRNLAVFITCRVTKPKFTSQIKERLKSPVPTIKLPDNFAKVTANWQVIQQLQAILDAKDIMLQRATDGDKVRRVRTKGIDDANLAGTVRAPETTFITCEGDSARKYVDTMRDQIPDGCDYFGIGSLRGKPLNIIKATTKQLTENAELIQIKKVLGLKEGLDYTVPANRATLRYGRILFACDNDNDGLHIKGLLLLLFTHYPSLLQIPFVYSWETPVVRLTKGKDTLRFYRLSEYEKWVQEHPHETGWTPKYYKGLGTSKDNDVKEDLAIFRAIQHTIGQGGLEAMEMVFDEHFTDARKRWITEWQPYMNGAPEKVQTLAEFVNDDLILYAKNTLTRALPSLMDGLKNGQRKCLYGGRKEIPYSRKECMIVARAAGRIAEKTAYHHGQFSIEETIQRMGLDHVGTNNLPYFFREGQFGNRKDNKLVAARYPMTKINWWIDYVFRREDDPILPKQFDDGDEIEPAYFLPIVPMLLVNGCRTGVAMGWSTTVPAHNPIDIVNWLIAYLEARQRGLDPSDGTVELPALVPWYRGFQGTIEVLNNKYISRGNFEVIGATATGRKVEVTELPLFRTFDTYKEDLNELIEAKLLRDYESKSTDTQPRFILSGFKEEPTYTNLKIQRVHSTANMIVLDLANKPVEFNLVTELMQHYAWLRLQAYSVRKDYQLGQLGKDLVQAELKLRYLHDVVSDQLVIMKRNLSELRAEMATRGYPNSFLNLKGIAFTAEGLAEAAEEIAKIKAKIEELSQIPPEVLWIRELQEFLAAYKRHYRG